MPEEKAVALKETTELRTFEEVKESVQELNKFYTKLMQKGTDYDTIPGTPKPTLLKSGAELLRLRFGFNPQFKINKGLTDISRGFIEYDVICSLYKDGDLFAEGVGNANSLESKWRYRWVDEKDIPKGTAKEDLTVKWIKTKTGGSYPKYRMDNENPQDQANTILKIAKKRAFVDAILTATGASRIFTQDIEEMDGGILEPDKPEEDPIKPAGNPLVDAAKQAGAVELPNISKTYPKLLTQYPELSLGNCWEHGDVWVDGEYGKYHRMPKGSCYLRNKIRDMTMELIPKHLGFNSHEEPKKRGDKMVRYLTDEFKGWLKKDREIDDWNKTDIEKQLEVLESLIEE